MFHLLHLFVSSLFVAVHLLYVVVRSLTLSVVVYLLYFVDVRCPCYEILLCLLCWIEMRIMSWLIGRYHRVLLLCCCWIIAICCIDIFMVSAINIKDLLISEMESTNTLFESFIAWQNSILTGPPLLLPWVKSHHFETVRIFSQDAGICLGSLGTQFSSLLPCFY